MMYRDRIELPPETTLATAEMVDQYLIESGQIEDGDTRSRSFSIEVDGDLWDLRETLAEIEQRLHSMGIDFIPDRTKVKA